MESLFLDYEFMKFLKINLNSLENTKRLETILKILLDTNALIRSKGSL